MDEALKKKIKWNQFEKIAIWQDGKEETPFTAMVSDRSNGEKPLNLVVAYVYSLQEMKDLICQLWTEEVLAIDGQVYLIYPKAKNKIGHPAIGRDDIFPYLAVDEETGYVPMTHYKFNRMVAIDDNYTLVGLKHVPINAKQKVAINKTSQRVADYANYVDTLLADLAAFPEAQAFYQKLTPGYQKDWARHIFSAKQEATRDKRFAEMVDSLQKGFKTRDLYKAHLKN